MTASTTLRVGEVGSLKMGQAHADHFVFAAPPVSRDWLLDQ